MQKSPTHMLSLSLSHTSAREPHTSTKESYHSATKICTSAKEPCGGGNVLQDQSPTEYTSTRAIYNHKRALKIRKRTLHIRKRALHIRRRVHTKLQTRRRTCTMYTPQKSPTNPQKRLHICNRSRTRRRRFATG